MGELDRVSVIEAILDQRLRQREAACRRSTPLQWSAAIATPLPDSVEAEEDHQDGFLQAIPMYQSTG